MRASQQHELAHTRGHMRTRNMQVLKGGLRVLSAQLARCLARAINTREREAQRARMTTTYTIISRQISKIETLNSLDFLVYS